MGENFNMEEVQKRVKLQDGSNILLLDRLAKQHTFGVEECARNIFRVDSAGILVWQVETAFDSDGGSFTNIVADGSKIKGYRWDGGEYLIDVEDGRGVPVLLAK